MADTYDGLISYSHVSEDLFATKLAGKTGGRWPD